MTPEHTPIKSLVSNCCGVRGTACINKTTWSFHGDASWEDLQLCPECKEPCEYVAPDDRFRETDDLPEGLFTSND